MGLALLHLVQFGCPLAQADSTGKSGYQFGDATPRPVGSGLIKSIFRSPKQWAGKKLEISRQSPPHFGMTMR
jgi:hypothetical protein